MPWVKRFNTDRRPDTINLRRPFGHWVHGVLEKAPEPRGKEHHFGHDEHKHAVSQPDGNNWRVIAGMGLVNDVRPPSVHDVKDTRQPDEEDKWSDIVEPENES